MSCHLYSAVALYLKGQKILFVMVHLMQVSYLQGDIPFEILHLLQAFDC